jgi:hypothetical protein
MSLKTKLNKLHEDVYLETLANTAPYISPSDPSVGVSEDHSLTTGARGQQQNITNDADGRLLGETRERLYPRVTKGNGDEDGQMLPAFTSVSC